MSLSSSSDANFNADRTVTSSDIGDFASNYPYLFNKLRLHPMAYAVRVEGNYPSLEASASSQEKAGVVMEILRQQGYSGYSCMMLFKGDNTQVAAQGMLSPTGEQQQYLDIVGDIYASMDSSQIVLQGSEGQTPTLKLVSYDAIKPHLDKVRSVIALDSSAQEAANSGMLSTAARYIPIFGLMHAAGVYFAFAGDPSLLMALVVFDTGYISYLTYTGPISTMLAVVAAAATEAAVYTATLASFSTYLESVIGSDEVTIDVETFAKKDALSWAGYKAKQVGAIENEAAVESLVNQFIQTLSRLQIGSTLVAGKLAGHAAFAKYQPALKVKAINAAIGVGTLAVGYFTPVAVPLMVTAQFAFNFAIQSYFGKPLSQVLFPGFCTKSAAFFNFPMEHTCYELKKGVLDYPGYLAVVGWGIYKYGGGFVTWLARHKVKME